MINPGSIKFVLRRTVLKAIIACTFVFNFPLNVYAVNELEVESQIKAAFLGRFLGFIEKEGASDVIIKAESQPTICIYGAPAIINALEALAGVSRVNVDKVSFKPVGGANEALGCSILYIGPGQAVRVPELLSSLKNNAVVTVSDLPGFAAEGGMIELVKDGPHIKFILNRTAAKNSGIKFAAQLLSLAKKVIE